MPIQGQFRRKMEDRAAAKVREAEEAATREAETKAQREAAATAAAMKAAAAYAEAIYDLAACAKRLGVDVDPAAAIRAGIPPRAFGAAILTRAAEMADATAVSTARAVPGHAVPDAQTWDTAFNKSMQKDQDR